MPIHGNQVRTLDLQSSYDNKLKNATYDALKAFQLNTLNSDTSDIANSKLRDISASANTFFNSIASNFNMAGYNKNILSNYVPALVYTMYDGYYIYSPYTNTLDTTNTNLVEENGSKINLGSDADILAGEGTATYWNGQEITGIKPYIYYSCRYVDGNTNVVITYSLDNYITIQGKVNGNGVFDSGYLLDNIEIKGSDVYYRKAKILNETVKGTVYDPEAGKVKTYPCITIDGVKYYQDENQVWFNIINGKRYNQGKKIVKTSAAKEYYKEANDFKKRIQNYGLDRLTADKAVDENGNPLMELDENGNSTGKPKFGTYKIFDFGGSGTQSIEDPNSNFNQQRLAVIRYSIEKNLSIAIANYNHFSGEGANFQMPALKENEWEDIINNISIISFLQGLNIGGKIYNGYAIVTNNKNKEVVSEDSIYILTTNDQYHKANDQDLLKYSESEIETGVFNIDFEVKIVTIESTSSTISYMSKQRENSQDRQITGCYSSIISQTNMVATDNFYQYMEEKGKLAQVYYTALGRERYGMYKTNTDYDTIKEKFFDPI